MHQGGFLVKVHNTICMQVLQFYFFLKLLCEYCIIRALRVYPSNEDIAFVDYGNSALKPSLMREWLILSWPKSMFFFDIHTRVLFIWFYGSCKPFVIK
jgi:hypothetical protein